MTFRKLIIKLRILQEKTYIPDEYKDLVHAKMFKRRVMRINPFNPLSYITLVLTFIVGIICFGVIGFWEQTDKTNPFKWR